MARKEKSSTVTVGAQNNVEAQPAPVVPQEVVQSGKAKRSAKRAEIVLRGADGKPAHGLTDIASVQALGYVFSMPATHLVVRAQFKAAQYWFAFCAWRAEQEAEHYNTLAADAGAQPDKYKRVAASTKLAQENKALAAKLAQLEAMLAKLQGAR